MTSVEFHRISPPLVFRSPKTRGGLFGSDPKSPKKSRLRRGFLYVFPCFQGYTTCFRPQKSTFQFLKPTKNAKIFAPAALFTNESVQRSLKHKQYHTKSQSMMYMYIKIDNSSFNHCRRRRRENFETESSQTWFSSAKIVFLERF